MPLALARALTQFLETHHAGGEVIAVGGYVRDLALAELTGKQAPIKDLDLEVYHIAPEDLRTSLLKFARTHDLFFTEVGKSFGVFKVGPMDVAVPRRESQHGPRHQDFLVVGDPEMTFPEAASRRDFTINSMGLHLVTGQWLDPFQGREHLQMGRLQHVSPAFSEDPLRVLRGAQFMARFKLTLAPETAQLCRTLTAEFLSRERIEEEFDKLLTKGICPSLGLEMLRWVGWLRFWPELDQDLAPWNLTCQAVDQARGQLQGLEHNAKLRIMYACLCHQFSDLGAVKNFLRRVTENRDLTEGIIRLVAHFDAPRQSLSTPEVYRLANHLAPQTHIGELVRCHLPLPRAEQLMAQANALGVAHQALVPLLMGRHLTAQGYQPGPQFKLILAQALDAQIEGKFHDLPGALAWLSNCYGKSV
jgi:tRNA nucleotidyltransferase (CCA-adding enzyme)